MDFRERTGPDLLSDRAGKGPSGAHRSLRGEGDGGEAAAVDFST